MSEQKQLECVCGVILVIRLLGVRVSLEKQHLLSAFRLPPYLPWIRAGRAYEPPLMRMHRMPSRYGPRYGVRFSFVTTPQFPPLALPISLRNLTADILGCSFFACQELSVKPGACWRSRSDSLRMVRVGWHAYARRIRCPSIVVFSI
jgi:hypothetical protein